MVDDTERSENMRKLAEEQELATGCPCAAEEPGSSWSGGSARHEMQGVSHSVVGE